MVVVNFTLIILLAVFCCWGFFHLSSAMPPQKEPQKPAVPPRMACSVDMAKDYVAKLQTMKSNEEWKAANLDGQQAERACWLATKAAYVLHRVKAPKATLDDEKLRFLVEDTYVMLLKANHQNDQNAQTMSEEGGGRLRTYRSPVDGTLQTYSVNIPGIYDPAVKWPLIVSMHGHGWYNPFQGHPAPTYSGAICLSPQGRGSTDYKDLGEDDVLAAIECVKKEFNIDPARVYLTGGSMGGTGAYHIGVHYADQFAGIFPIVGNADNLAWTERWGWNRIFEGRNNELRQFVQEGHTARAFAQNLRNLPTYILAGAADTVVPPAHSRNVVAELRRMGIPVEYREYPSVGHGGFSADAQNAGLSWICGWTRNRYPKCITWKADLLKHGKAYWMKFEQLEKPMASGEIEVVAISDCSVDVQTRNLLAFSLQKPAVLFDKSKPLTISIDGIQLLLAPSADEGDDTWFTFRKHPGTGKWMNDADVEVQPLTKHKGCEGPVQEAFMAPFILVIGTENPAMNDVWMHEAMQFAEDWKFKNAGYPRIILDSEITEDIELDYNLILFGGSSDNAVSARIVPQTPLKELQTLLRFQKGADTEGTMFDSPDVGSIIVYPNVLHAPNRLTVIIHANAPESAYQLWGRFGNWFNWGVFDSKKYFDFAIFDGKSSSPETMLLVGWFGTDWSIRNSAYFFGDSRVRDNSAKQHFPSYADIAAVPSG
ncbi:MAG: prolyl oligopeptidase family serine peptidase, partial [Victivallales bacterium]|nr:prolyl oligopeptidase family serine peptidase [Victivallales bacterium]